MDATADRGPRVAARRPGEFPCVDGVRAMAAMAVIVFHSVAFSTGAFHTVGGRWLVHLNVGVWVFFTISGFLLYLPFAAEHLTARNSVGLRGYAVRRVARIYPAYWVALAFWVVVLPRTNIGGKAGALSYVTLTQSYFTLDSVFRGLPIAWTLVTEVTFYAFLPLYAWAVAAVARRASSPLGVELTGIAVLIAVGIGSDALPLWASVTPPLWVTVLPLRLHVFALGMLLAVLTAQPWDERGRRVLARVGRSAWLWWMLALLAFLAIPLVIGVAPTRQASELQQLGGDLCRALVGIFVVVPVVLGPQDHGAIRRLLRTPVLVYLGVVSYGLYLWHYFVLGSVQSDLLDRRFASGNWLTLLAVALPVVVLAATASWYLVERPAQRLARRALSSVAAPTSTRRRG